MACRGSQIAHGGDNPRRAGRQRGSSPPPESPRSSIPASTASDTGWNGAIAGARNRWLRWDTTQAIDTRVAVELRLQVKSGTGQAPRQEGYPNEGDLFTAQLPVLVDVTPRRLKKFQLVPGELVRWEFGGRSGVVTTQSDGTVTVPQVPVTTSWQTLRLTRAP